MSDETSMSDVNLMTVDQEGLLAWFEHRRQICLDRVNRNPTNESWIALNRVDGQIRTLENAIVLEAILRNRNRTDSQ